METFVDGVGMGINWVEAGVSLNIHKAEDSLLAQDVSAKVEKRWSRVCQLNYSYSLGSWLLAYILPMGGHRRRQKASLQKRRGSSTSLFWLSHHQLAVILFEGQVPTLQRWDQGSRGL